MKEKEHWFDQWLVENRGEVISTKMAWMGGFEMAKKKMKKEEYHEGDWIDALGEFQTSFEGISNV